MVRINNVVLTNGMLCDYLMSLFRTAGHIDTATPIFKNHSSKKVVYFDCAENVIITDTQESLLKYFENVSYLFMLDSHNDSFQKNDTEAVCVYSAELLCKETMRTQTAYEVHRLLHSLIEEKYTVIVFGFEDQLLFSFASDDKDYIMSDWFDIENQEEILEIIHIANMSLKSALDYFSDMAYSVAREYYRHPMSKEFVQYSLLPANFKEQTDGYATNKWIAERTKEILDSEREAYGQDYFDFAEASIVQYEDASKELDLLWLELEAQESAVQEVDIRQKMNSAYEFDDIDDEAFADPEKLLEVLEDFGY